MNRLVRVAAAVVLLAAMGQSVRPGVAWADLTSCQASISPQQVGPGSDNSFVLGISDTSATDIAWVKVYKPSDDTITSIQSASAYQWQADIQPDSVVFTQGNVTAGGSQNFGIEAVASGNVGNSEAWTVQVSDDPGGANAIVCSGDTSVTVQTQPTSINISNVQVATVGTDRVTIKWDTDVAATSQVRYGTDGSYGQSTPINSTLVTSHLVLVTGLTASTSYHFIVTSTTPSDGGTSSSGDNTFLTADVGAVTAGGDIPKPSSGGVITTPSGKVTETTPPTIVLTTKLAAVYQTSPTIEGRATDNDSVAKVEYTTDGGKNWTTVDEVTQSSTTTGKGKKKKTVVSAAAVTFSFRPVIVEDGNYTIMARATDPSGNQTATAPVTVVIDRLPPRFGVAVVMVGPQQVLPDAAGRLVLPAGVDFRVNVSLVGGPVSVMLRGARGAEAGQSFSLRRGAESGLWLGVLSFAKTGRYELTGRAVDGADNRTSRVLATVEVVSPITVKRGGNAVKGVTATLYNRDPEDHNWTVWDGATYGQDNPQVTDAAGSLHWLVPPGTYYVKLAVAGGLDTLTRSFSLTQPAPLSGMMELGTLASLKLGPLAIPLPWTALAPAPVVAAATGAATGPTGGRLPLVQLPTTAGGVVSPVDWYGKPTVVAVVTTWAPSSVEQLGALAELQHNSDINTVMLAEEQRAETVAAYLKIAGGGVTAVADPDGLLSNVLSVPGIPALYFIDRHGIIKKVMVGTRSAEEILTALSRL